jgi:hypothetical protein
VDRIKKVLDALTGEFLWATILVPILAISWLGFYTIARAVGVPPVFAAGMSAAFDGVALFAARIGLKHRRKGFSGYLARMTVIAFAALGAFVQSFHSDTTIWVHEHAWIVWATAPVAGVLAYELHLGWAHRKQLIKMGYVHPSAKSGFGPATWIILGGTWSEYRNVLRKRRDFIVAGNLRRFELEEAAQPQLAEPSPPELAKPRLPEPVLEMSSPPAPSTPKPAPRPRPLPRPRPEPQGPPGPRLVHSAPKQKRSAASTQRTARPRTKNAEIAAWCVDHGIALGYRNRVPAEGLRAYRAAHPNQTSSAAA